MHPLHRILLAVSTLGILLMVISGCSQKALHVSTTSGESAQQEELAAGLQSESSDEGGMENASLSESSLGQQLDSSDSTGQDLVMGEDPSLGDSSSLSASDSPAGDTSGSTQAMTGTGAGQEIQAQSSSESATQGGSGGPLAGLAPLGDSADSSAQSTEDRTGVMETLDENSQSVERIPGNIAVAKAESSEAAARQLERIREEEMATLASGIQDIFFEFDSWTITPDGKQVLEKNAELLETKSFTKLLIEGHCDQRGTQAYNIILGKKRAGAIRDYLVGLGVEPSRLAMISYGQDKPFCSDPTETCYQLNRRGHLLVQQP